MPVTRTAGYTVTDAIRDAEMYVMEYPAQGTTPQARVFYHTIMTYLREVGISPDERKQIISLWVEAEFTTWQDGWGKGYTSGFGSAKNIYGPPF